MSVNDGETETLKPGHLDVIYVQPVWATPFPTPYFGPRGGSGGSWDD